MRPHDIFFHSLSYWFILGRELFPLLATGAPYIPHQQQVHPRLRTTFLFHYYYYMVMYSSAHSTIP